MTAYLSIESLCVGYGSTRVLDDVSLGIGKGELVALLGSSGCGKTTLLRMLAGFEQPTSGRILIDGADMTDVPPYERPVNLMFQSYALFPHMTVGENLLFAIPRAVRSRRERRELMRQALAEADLAGYEERHPATLSGGQRARVALMRTLLARPRAVLLDEPFSKLDADLQATIRQFVFGHVRAQGLPTLMVTHAAEDAQAAGGPVMRVGRPVAGSPAETLGAVRPGLSGIRPAAKPRRP